MNIEDQMEKLMKELTEEELCAECGKRPIYEMDYCEECQFERDVCRAEMRWDSERGH